MNSSFMRASGIHAHETLAYAFSEINLVENQFPETVTYNTADILSCKLYVLLTMNRLCLRKAGE